MKILVMLYCADVDQLIVSDSLNNEFEKIGTECVVKDLASYRFANHGTDELAYMSGFYGDLKSGNYDAIVFLHSYPAHLYSKIKSVKKINISSFIVNNYELNFGILHLKKTQRPCRKRQGFYSFNAPTVTILFIESHCLQ